MSKIKTILSIIFIFTIWGCVSSAYPILLWWSRECVLYLVIIIKPEVWIINHCLGLGHETMVCAVCLTMFLRTYIFLGPGVHYIGHFSWCFESWCPIYWTFNYHNFNFINIRILIALKITVRPLRISYHFYLKFQNEFKSFVKYGLNALYCKLKN